MMNLYWLLAPFLKKNIAGNGSGIKEARHQTKQKCSIIDKR